MPQIPPYLARTELPATTGVRPGGVQVPTVLSPTARDTGPSALEQVSATLPQTVQQIGQLEVQRERAQGFLDGKSRFQDVRPALRTQLETMKEQSPYQTLPEDFLKASDTMIEQFGSTLSGQAKQIYLEAAKQERNALHLEATQTRAQRRDGAMTMSTMTEVQWTQDQFGRSRTDFERAYHWESLQNLLTGAVEHGLMRGEVAAKILTETDKGLQLGQARTQMRADPVGAVQDLGAALTGGTPAHPAYQGLSPTLLPDLFDEATKQLHGRVVLQEAQESRQKRGLQEQQKQRASQYRAAIFKEGLSIPQLVGLLDPINKDRAEQLLGEEDHAQLLGHVRHFVEKLRDDAYKDRDLPDVAKAGTLRVETAQTPGDFTATQQWIYSNGANLSTSTTQGLLRRIEQRRDAADPLNDDQAKEARRLFLSGAFPGGIVPAMLDKIDSNIQAKTAAGLDLLNEQLRGVNDREGRDAMRAQAVKLGRQMKELYFPESATQTALLPPSMPKAFEGVTTFEDGLVVLEALQLSPELRRKYYAILKELPRRGPGTGVPSVPGLSQVPGVTKPRTPYSPLEQR